jgi:arsenate reductase
MAMNQAGLDPVFRDVRADPLTESEMRGLYVALGDALVNRRSTTWRGLSDNERLEEPVTLLLRHPTLMKRPVILDGETTYLGWTGEVRSTLGVD